MHRRCFHKPSRHFWLAVVKMQCLLSMRNFNGALVSFVQVMLASVKGKGLTLLGLK